MDWAHDYSAIQYHPYDYQNYSCGCFASDYANRFHIDYQTPGLLFPAVESLMGVPHSVTVVFTGGDWKLDTNWKVVTSNDDACPYYGTLGSHRDVQRHVCVDFTPPTKSQYII